MFEHWLTEKAFHSDYVEQISGVFLFIRFPPPDVSISPQAICFAFDFFEMERWDWVCFFSVWAVRFLSVAAYNRSNALRPHCFSAPPISAPAPLHFPVLLFSPCSASHPLRALGRASRNPAAGVAPCWDSPAGVCPCGCGWGHGPPPASLPLPLPPLQDWAGV